MNGRTPARAACALLASLFFPQATAQEPSADEHFQRFEWRELGPAVFGGRIVDLALRPGDASFLLVASASGGLWRTRNNGTTWDCIFENEGTISIGDIALDPSDDDVIWVGTGEANNQRSSYWGDGVYKTSDGGETWTNTGLADSHHIARIVVDPTDSDVVYVAALGHLYTPNAERGLYKTEDGGASWRQVLHVNEDVGVVDVVIDPNEPRTIYAASYERRRRAWNFDGAGPGSAIYKSTDAGGTWRKLTGGLPEGEIGRIGLALWPGDPSVLYATVSNQNRVLVVPEDDPTVGLRTRFKKGALRVQQVAESGGAFRAGLRRGDILVRLGEVTFDEPWSWVTALANYTEDEELDLVYTRDEDERETRVTIADLIGEVEAATRDREIGGEIYRTEDAGVTWVKRNTRAVGGSPAYYYGQIRVDPNDRERLYVVGVPLSTSTDGGVTWERIAGSLHVDHHAFVIDPNNSRRVVLGNDGGLGISYDQGATWDHYSNLPIAQFYAVGLDNSVPFRVYGGTQDNGTWGGPSRSRNGRGIMNQEWFRVGGGDGFYAQIDPTDPSTVYAESQFGAVYRRDVDRWQTRSIRPPRAAEGEPANRYNWNSPILISHHNSQIVYFGGNRLFKSYDRGDSWPVVSEDLTTADPDKIAGNVPHCTLTTIAESPFDPNAVLVGSDDGLVHLSEDGGLSWTNLAGRFPGVPSGWWVSRVEFSPHHNDTAYASFTGYREDDVRAFVYVTENRGRNWRRISDGLPQEPVNVVREDPVEAGVLYVGTELGAYVSVDAGGAWHKLGSGLPTIPVHDLVVHPRDGELVLATHGRGFWAMDVSVVRGLRGESLAKDAHLFAVSDVVRLQSRSAGGWNGDRIFRGANPASGATFSYYLGREFEKGELELRILGPDGKVVAEPDLERKPGLHVDTWNLRRRGEAQQGRRRRGGGSAPAGRYTIVLKVGDDEQRRTFEIKADPILD
ncbi:MAG: PDZ domain-containing protein [bacterium]|nr:PDZ domain-containing protein [bacterium]